MVENEHRFTKCLSSIFFGSLLMALFGSLFDGPAAQEIRDGTFEPPDRLNPFARDFLLELQEDRVPDLHKTSSSHISSKDNSVSWKKRQPGTSSEPSQLSFSHHIVAAFCFYLSEVDAALRSAPYEMGFAPIDWRFFTDFQILKMEGVYDVEKMRSILLMAALFNENNKKLAADTMWQAEQAGAIPPEHFGGRKGFSANLLLLEKVLCFDIIRQQRMAAIHDCLDAAQCYDRMAHPPTGLAMEKLSAPPRGNPEHV